MPSDLRFWSPRSDSKFCLIDDWLAGQRLRQRGPAPTLADSEVLTIEYVGEFLGTTPTLACTSTSAATTAVGSPPWAACTAPPSSVGRPTCGRSTSKLHRHLLDQVDFDAAVCLLDSVAVPICRFARAYRCRRLRELAAWGHDEVAKQTYLGLRAHLRVVLARVIVDGRLVPANLSDLAMAEDLLANVAGWVLADCWPRFPAVRRPPHQLKPAHRVSYVEHPIAIGCSKCGQQQSALRDDARSRSP
jgi:hypothetical protein